MPLFDRLTRRLPIRRRTHSTQHRLLLVVGVGGRVGSRRAALSQWCRQRSCMPGGFILSVLRACMYITDMAHGHTVPSKSCLRSDVVPGTWYLVLDVVPGTWYLVLVYIPGTRYIPILLYVALYDVVSTGSQGAMSAWRQACIHSTLYIIICTHTTVGWAR